MDILIQYCTQLIGFIVHIDQHLAELAVTLGPWLYVLLFGIVFAETGLVIFPILPGDSLLFAAGAIAALPGAQINVGALIVLLIIAAILGDFVNYQVGRFLGPKVFRSHSSWFFNKNHLEYTQSFYNRYGGKTIIIARFVPIVRTFAPFVAGIGKMTYAKFASFNVVGGVSWVLLFTLGGYWMGNLPAIQKNFHLMIFAIIGVSLAPAIFEFWRERRRLRGGFIKNPSSGTMK